MASEKGQSAQVKEFGQTMVRDHTMSGDALKQAVASYRIEMPTQVDEKHQDLANRLRMLQGMEFDREYMNAMVEGHENMKDMLEPRANETADGDDPAETAINGWVKKTLPTVQHHLDMAKQIHERVNQAGRNATN
jgi:putative membrane protein